MGRCGWEWRTSLRVQTGFMVVQPKPFSGLALVFRELSWQVLQCPGDLRAGQTLVSFQLPSPVVVVVGVWKEGSPLAQMLVKNTQLRNPKKSQCVQRDPFLCPGMGALDMGGFNREDFQFRSCSVARAEEVTLPASTHLCSLRPGLSAVSLPIWVPVAISSHCCRAMLLILQLF